MADEGTEVSHRPLPDPSPAAFQKIATLDDIAMDFTLENWEQLGQGQGDLFWDTALDNYQNLFLLSECHPCPGSHRPAQGSPMALWHLWGDLLAPERLRSLCLVA